MFKSYQKSNTNSSTFSYNFDDLLHYFINSCHFMPLPFLKFLPSIVLAIANCESVIFDDLATFIAPNLHIEDDSAKRRISRFINNSNYDFDFFYKKFITSIISTYKIKHDDKRVHITMDHMSVEDRFTNIVFTLKLGKQSIPLFYKTSDYLNESVFSFDIFKAGVNFCHDLIKNIDKDADIIFLADRFWGNHFKLMKYADSLGDTYCFRARSDLKVLAFNKKENHFIWTKISDLPHYVHHSKLYYDLTFTKKSYHMNLAISKSVGHKDPLYILTNGDPKRAIKDYSYRFPAIEFLFKAQKTNGFFLEETQLKSPDAFNALYTCVCIAQVLLTMIGIDNSKNQKVKIRNSKIVNGKKRKEHSFFQVGLKLLKGAIYSNTLIKFFKRMVLYDV